MAIHKVLKYGDSRLLRTACRVEHFDTPELQQLITDMFDTMQSLDGAGLAAPQINVNQRVVIFASQDNPRYEGQEAVPETVLINPKIEILDDAEDQMWEGCLSIPGMRGLVSRPRQIRYSGQDQFGEPIERVVDGFHAVVVQHECDHLDGILYPMRVKDLSNFGFVSELDRQLQ